MSGPPPGGPGGPPYRPQGPYGRPPAPGVRPPGSGLGGPPGQQPQQQQGGVQPAGAPPGMRPVAAPRPSFGPGSPAAPGSGGSAGSGSGFGGPPRPLQPQQRASSLGPGGPQAQQQQPQQQQQQQMGAGGSGSLPNSPAVGSGGAMRPPGAARPPFGAGGPQARPPLGQTMPNGTGPPSGPPGSAFAQQPRPGAYGQPQGPPRPGFGGPPPQQQRPPPQQQQQQQQQQPGGFGAPRPPFGAQQPPAIQPPPGSQPPGGFGQPQAPPASSGPPGMRPPVPGGFRPPAPGAPRPEFGGPPPPGGAVRSAPGGFGGPPGPPGAGTPSDGAAGGPPGAGYYGQHPQQSPTGGPPVPPFGGARPPPFGAPSPRPPGFGGPPPGQFGGVRPPPPGAGGGGLAGGFGAAPGYDAASLASQFEQLALGPGQNPTPGQPPDAGPDVPHFPRPLGAEAAAGEPPPAVDPHSCDPAYLRPTTTVFPGAQTLRARWQLPLGLIVHPMNPAGRPVPVSQMGSAGIVRCKRCRTYINPFVNWTDGGRRFTCNVCDLMNDVPVDYYAGIDMATGRRTDEAQRPELSFGSVEYVAPTEYMVRPPMPPVYFFAIDVSAEAVSSGVLQVVCETIRAALDSLPGDERTLVGLVTYDAHVHFYNLKAGLGAPQMVVMSDTDDPFVPLPDDLLVNLRESRAVFEGLLDAIPATFAANSQTHSAFGPALQCIFLIMAGIGGKLLVFQSAPPSVGVGRVPKNRDDARMYGTEREHITRTPEDPFFKKYAAEASRVQMSVDIFCLCSHYTDLASLGPISHYTCGQVYYYPGFSAQRDAPKLRAELMHNLTRETGWEAVMRVRCSRGLRVSSFHGPMFVRSTDLLALPQVDPDKAFAVQVVLEESVVNSRISYVQCALLYTNSNGERRIRVHTLAVPIAQDLNALYAGADAGAVAALLAKLAVEKSLHGKLEDTRTMLVQRLVAGLKEFRALHAAHFRAHHRIIWPASLRMLPLYLLGLTKCAAFRGGQRDVGVDERLAVALNIQGASVADILRLAYPSLYALHDPQRGVPTNWGTKNEEGRFILPAGTAAESSQLSTDGAYLLDNGRLFLLWLGHSVSRDFVAQIFGLPPDKLPQEVERLPLEPAQGDSDVSRRFNALLGALRAGRAMHGQVFVVRQGSALEARVGPYLVEDGSPGGPAYQDWLLQCHKAVLTGK